MKSGLFTPSQIVIIRHAEKPEVGIEINEVGQKRAHLLPIYFDTNNFISEYGSPVAIYAAAPINEGDSIRSIQTVIPLATHLNVQINQNFTKKNIHGLVDNIMNNSLYYGRTIVICWDHSGIPSIARFFGVLESPEIWNSNVYDRTWVIRFGGHKVTKFMDLPQKLLPYDSLE